MTDAPADTTPPPQNRAPDPAAPPLAASAPAPSTASPPGASRRQAPFMLRLIALVALIKTLLFGATGFFVIALSHHDVADTLNTLLRSLSLDPDAEYLHKAVAGIAGVSVKDLRLFGAGFFFYATLYLVEAIGLWLDQTWAEWLTIVGSGLLIPIEIMEMFKHLTVINSMLFLLNVAVVVYLVVRVRRKLRLHHARKLAEAAALTVPGQAPTYEGHHGS